MILCLLVAQVAFAQGKVTVSGTVLDANGGEVIGATVQEHGTTNGTVTDIDGHYSLKVSPNATLDISYIGYSTASVKVGNGGDYTTRLEENENLMEEVVVVGYGVQKKVNLTGAVSSLSSKDIEDIPAANAASLLQGRLPGVVLTSQGGQAGNDTPEIRVRGVNTLSDNNDPMVLIDGVESSVSDISQIAAADIDNVSVLKDAASASIYGVRAANGVILITTKRGKESRPTVTYQGSVSWQSATVLPDYVDSYNWAIMYNEMKDNEIYSASMLEAIKNGTNTDQFANTDWVDEMFRTAFMTQHSLQVAGGSKDTHYMFSVGYLNQDGILETTGYERYNFRANVDTKVKRFTFGLNVSGSKEEVDAPTADVDSEDGVMRYLTWFTRPTVPVKYSNGEWGQVDGSSLGYSIFKNPIQALNEGHRTEYGYHFDINAYAMVDIWNGLQFKTSLAYKYYSNDISTYSPTTSKYDYDGNLLYQSTTNSLTEYNWNNYSYLNENIFTYSNTFGGKHDVGALLGHSIQYYHEKYVTAYKENFATDNLYVLDAGTENASVSGSASEYSLQSFFGRVTYAYDSRYLFEFNIRHDGSSRMPKKHRYATFPSVSAGWIITNESFMPKLDWMSYLKIRASWGMLGNQEIGDYAYSATMAANYNYYFGDTKVIGLAEDIVANDDIKWETTTITDIGLDATFWHNRINVTFDYFNKLTKDILLQLSMPTTYLGTLSAPYQNAGKVRNRGWELSANYNDGRGDWHWNAGFSLSFVRNKIVDNCGIDTYGSNTINREGYAIGSYYGLKAIGIYRTEEDLNRTNADGVVITQNGATPSLGDIMYEDTDGDGNVDSDDRQIIGNPFPKLSYSFTLGATWKNWDLTTFWQGVAGVYRYVWEPSATSNGGNMTSSWLDRWSEDNPDGSMPRLGNSYNETYSSFWLKKADYLRLKNLEFGYTFNKGTLKTVGIDKLRVYFQATNLLTFTPLENYDPEKSSTDTRSDAHPNTKSFSFGVNVNF